jgi:hypothetical protein
MRVPACFALPGFLVAALAVAAPPAAGPSRAAEKDCVWEKLSDARIGLEAWVQRCDFGSRKVSFLFAGSSLAVHYSDGGAPEPLVDVHALQPGESPETGVKRFFAAHTDKKLVARCVLKPVPEMKAPAGVQRITFVPDAAYQKELDAKSDPGEVPEPPCGEWGTDPDGIEYFEIQPASGAHKFLFVRVGQDQPLFDEETLRLLPEH